MLFLGFHLQMITLQSVLSINSEGQDAKADMRMQHKQQKPPCQSQSVAIMNGIMQWDRRFFCKEIWLSNPLAFFVTISCWCIGYQVIDNWMSFYSKVALHLLLKCHCNLFLCLSCLFFHLNNGYTSPTGCLYLLLSTCNISTCNSPWPIHSSYRVSVLQLSFACYRSQ